MDDLGVYKLITYEGIDVPYEKEELTMAQFGSGANKRDYNFDESKLRPGQREAALLLVEYEFLPKDERITHEEIAERVGSTRNTIHTWRTRDRNFIEYKNYLSADFFDSYLPFVYSKLIDGISNGSMKGIELYLKRMGDLDNRSEVTINDNNSDKTHDERKKELMERLRVDEGPKGDSDNGGRETRTKDG